MRRKVLKSLDHVRVLGEAGGFVADGRSLELVGRDGLFELLDLGFEGGDFGVLWCGCCCNLECECVCGCSELRYNSRSALVH